ncbi:MAG TPA: hypothetical protein VFG39_01005 [Balneolaceae bacterium]|nr:hypothetical protein [Balneolaceae bacterium]
MSKRVLLSVILLIFAGNSLVQAQQKQEVRTELSMVWGFAQGAFGENLGHPIPGILLSFGGKTPNWPLVLTTEIGWLNYGFDNYLEIRYPNGNTPASGLSVVDIETGNSILMTHLVARVLPLQGKISPYIDLLLGFKYLRSDVFIESDAIVGDDGLITIVDDGQILTSSTFDSFALSYGVGAGVDIVVFEGLDSGGTLSLNVGVRYLFGSEADYLAENSIRPTTSGILFEQIESNTNMLIPKLGLRLGL